MTMRIHVLSGIFSLMLVACICRAQEAKTPVVAVFLENGHSGR